MASKAESRLGVLDAEEVAAGARIVNPVAAGALEHAVVGAVEELLYRGCIGSLAGLEASLDLGVGAETVILALSFEEVEADRVSVPQVGTEIGVLKRIDSFDRSTEGVGCSPVYYDVAETGLAVMAAHAEEGDAVCIKSALLGGAAEGGAVVELEVGGRRIVPVPEGNGNGRVVRGVAVYAELGLGVAGGEVVVAAYDAFCHSCVSGNEKACCCNQYDLFHSFVPSFSF